MTIDWGPWLSIAIRSVVLLLALFHLSQVVEESRRHRDNRALRDVILGTVVLVGVTALWAAGWVLFAEALRDVARFIGVVAAGALLVGMTALAVSHFMEGRRG